MKEIENEGEENYSELTQIKRENIRVIELNAKSTN